MKNKVTTVNPQPNTPISEADLQAREENLKLQEHNLRQREIELTAFEAEHHKAMLDLKEEKMNYQALRQELNEQKTFLIQLCKDIDFEYN